VLDGEVVALDSEGRSSFTLLQNFRSASALPSLKFVMQHGLEGVIAKRSDSIYEPGKRTGLWTKTRFNLGQEFVIGGYTPGEVPPVLVRSRA
jgi:ATP-dependent DNA ligase